MDVVIFLIGFIWIALGIVIAEGFNDDFRFEDNPLLEHTSDTYARYCAFIILWPVLLFVSFIVVFFFEE